MNFNEEAMKLREKTHGLLDTMPRVSLKTHDDLSTCYTPGVAQPCLAIQKDKDLSFDLTCRGNLIAVVTDGTRVLGLGNIGPEAALPVMEGKSLLFKVFGGVNAVPICIDTTDADKFIKTVKRIQPSFAGINLEDIESPKCYEIEKTLRKELDIPVFHDDQHGTAIAALAGVLGALRFVKKDLKTAKIVINGAGAAGSSIAKLLLRAGAERLLIVDRKGIIHKKRMKLNPVQKELAEITNPKGREGTLLDAATEADVLIGVSVANVFTPEVLQAMNPDAVVFAMANPIPEVDYETAKKAGIRVVGTGRSDAPNQINNVLVFPGVFRGALAVRARRINEDMKLAASYAIAHLIPDEELTETYVIPDSFDTRVAPAVAAAVAKAAMESGVARIEVDPAQVEKDATEQIAKLHEVLDMLHK